MHPFLNTPAYVTPFLQTSGPQSLNDLRLVATTTIPSLISEDFVFDWAYNKTCNYLDTQQFGNNISTSLSHCLVSFLEFIHNPVGHAFEHFRKAFGLVDHAVVINKAILLGISPNLIAKLADLLTGMQQSIGYQGSASTFQQLACGIPQGKKMDSLYFLILINYFLSHTPYL